jgi:hypothetical protein
LAELFVEYKTDIHVFELLSKELKDRQGDPASELHPRVAMALFSARKFAQQGAQHPSHETRSRQGLQRPDSRFLYRYRLSLLEWEELRNHLIRMVNNGTIDRADDRDAGVFALYGAEWFRREFEGGSYRWDEVLASIGGVSQETTKSLSRRGLKWWGRTPYRTEHGQQRLMSLVLEGGFPTRLLELREHGWLVATLRRLIARVAAIGDQSLIEAQELVREDAAIPETFRKEGFFLLLSELAVGIVSLRQDAGSLAATAGLPTSDWLDRNRQGWRDELPISLEGAGAGKLIDELVSQSMETPPFGHEPGVDP